jgi:hypothetical protein
MSTTHVGQASLDRLFELPSPDLSVGDAEPVP